ncbi:MAG: bifunctional DNA-formamidopyrimidine glycosylase/DNA-(apurinic or apyrimidinic site) lyase [Dehalococcoidales bacterium]|nr:bifunctional DNA-formamidopyrimidine glycosylase/DNA-(apurinic or apyrimidinic site) lyase [Dehalococcoidales bacterium]
MPELPEVETIKSELRPHIIGHRVTRINLGREGIIRQPSVGEFCSRLIGQEITELRRRGKYLIFSLSSGEALIIHLRMTGSLLLNNPGRFIRATIYLDRNTQIYLRDPRKLGIMELVADPDTIVGKLGPEALGDSFTPQILAKQLAKRKAPIKALLLDQHFIAGIGNMYADESLFAAGIHPERWGNSLTKGEVTKLHRCIQQVLKAAINCQGASVRSYFRPGGEVGTAHFQFQVAHRLGGKNCSVCGTPIERTVIRGRGSYFCPKCQPQSPKH